ncbi:MAG: PAS domain S-box protein [Methanomicrobiales archaeon]|nr:PAS domain S-box protein [Methanomicrobiales archaeon]
MGRIVEELNRIKTLLREHPQGMSITEISRELGKNMHSVGRYMDILHVSGQVEMRTYGMAKVYTQSRRCPIAGLISEMDEMIVILDGDRRVMQASRAALAFFGLSADDVVGRDLFELPFPEPALHDLFDALAPTLAQKPGFEDAHVVVRGQEYYLKIRTIATAFEDGSAGYVLLLIDVTLEKQALRALQESEHNYRDLVELADAIILKLDPAGRVTFLNEYAVRFFGFTREELLGRSVIGTIVPPVDLAGRDLQAMIAELCADPAQYAQNENTNITKDGREVWIRWTNRAILDETGAPSGVLCVGNDITPRKRMEEALRNRTHELEKRVRELGCLYRISSLIGSADDERELLEGVADALPSGLQHAAHAAARIIIGERVFGAQPPENAAARLAAPLPPNGSDGTIEMWYDTGVPPGGKLFLSEERLLIDTVALRLGRVLEHLRLEHALVSERDFAGAILDAIGALVMVIDAGGRIVRFNRQCEALTGYAAGEVAGRPAFETVLPPGEAGRILAVMQDLRAGKGSLRAAVEVIGRDGRRHRVAWSFEPLKIGGKAGACAVMTGMPEGRE